MPINLYGQFVNHLFLFVPVLIEPKAASYQMPINLYATLYQFVNHTISVCTSSIIINQLTSQRVTTSLIRASSFVPKPFIVLYNFSAKNAGLFCTTSAERERIDMKWE